jgi:hypothetical protein
MRSNAEYEIPLKTRSNPNIPGHEETAGTNPAAALWPFFVESLFRRRERPFAFSLPRPEVFSIGLSKGLSWEFSGDGLFER